MYEGREDPEEVADYVAHMPRGGAIGEWIGGALAITPETEGMWEISYILAKVNADNPSKVKPREYPVGLRDQHVKGEKASAKAEAYRRRQRVQKRPREASPKRAQPTDVEPAGNG